MAPLGDSARASPRLSARMTARIQTDGIANRCDASATKPANGSAATAMLSGFGPTWFGMRDCDVGEQHHRDGNAQAEPPDSHLPSSPSPNDGRRYGRNGGGPEPLQSRWRGAVFEGLGHGQSSSLIQSGATRPTMVVAGSGPKYRPSNEFSDCQFMEEDFVIRDVPAAPPAGQDPSRTIAVERAAHGHPVNRDRETSATDRLPWKGEDMFQKRHAHRQIATLSEKDREGFWGPDQNELTDAQGARWMHPVEADGHTGAGIPDQLGNRMEQRRRTDDDHGEASCHDPADARHGSTFLRKSHARCCSRL